MCEQEMKQQPVSIGTFTWALCLFVLSSVGMMLGNKLAVQVLPLPSTLVLVQVFGTLLLLSLYRNQLQRFRLDVLREWLPIALLFSSMIYTSMKSFLYVNVSTMLIFRNISAIVTTVVEYWVRGTTVNTEIVLSELTIVLGAILYGWGSANFSWIGFLWILTNVGAQVAYGVTLKLKMDGNSNFKEMSKYTMSLYNNTLAIPPLLLILFVQGEHTHILPSIANVTPAGWGTISLTCFLGFLISTSGFGLQKLVSASVFIVINNLSKFLNIFLGMLWLNDQISGTLDAAGCVVAILGGCWFSFAQMRFLEQEKKKKSSTH